MRVRAQRPSYWIGETFDTWKGGAGRRRTVLPAPRRGHRSWCPRAGPRPRRAERSADLLHGPADPQPDLPRRQRRRGVVPGPQASTPATTPSCRPSASGPGPSTRSSRWSTPPPRPSSDGHRPADPAPGQSERRRATARTLPAGPGPGPEDHRRERRRTPRSRPSSRGSAPHPLLTDIPPLRPGPTPSTSSSSATGPGSANRSPRAGRHAAIARHPRPEAVGYVPGSYNPITDLYEVQGKDAHAWVQVWFAQYGWQSFDPPP